MNRQTRILLPWFERQEAIGALLGFRVPAEGEDISAIEAVYDRQRAALFARPPFEERCAVAGPLPPEAEAAGARALATYEAAAPPPVRGPTRLAVVDLTHVLSFQKFVWIDDVGERTAAANDWASLADLCLPAHNPQAAMMEGTFDANGRAVTLTSPNPNLRAGPLQNVMMSVASGDHVIGFPIMFGLPFVHVVEYRNRYFLKDGYHRTHGLLSHGITRIPCLLETGRTFADVHGGSTTQVGADVLFGTHPPRLTDFFDPSVTALVERRAFKKVVRIQAEEFIVNV